MALQWAGEIHQTLNKLLTTSPTSIGLPIFANKRHSIVDKHTHEEEGRERERERERENAGILYVQYTCTQKQTHMHDMQKMQLPCKISKYRFTILRGGCEGGRGRILLENGMSRTTLDEGWMQFRGLNYRCQT
jgi:hypothetical protein